MKSYAIDSVERHSVPIYFCMGVFAAGAAWLFQQLLICLGVQELPWWVESPSVLGLFGVIWKIFDVYGWRIRFGTFGVSKIPDLNGSWLGSIRSDFQQGNETKAVIQIKQTWTKILVRLQTNNSSSISTMAAVNTSDSSEWGLHYEYLSEPVSTAVGTMQMHRGTTHFRIEQDGLVLRGDYYGGRGRQNLGSIEVRRVFKRANVSLTESLKQTPPNP